MELLRPDPEQVPYGLSAMVMVARAAEGGLGQPQRALLDAIQRVILHSDIDVASLPPIGAQELATRLRAPALRRQLVQGMVVMCLVNGPSSPAQSELIEAFAVHMGVDEPAIKVIHHLADRELLQFRLDFYRRSHLRDAIESTYRRNGGVLAVAKTILGLPGLVADKALAARFEAWGTLAAGTTGRAVHDYYRANGLAFPG